MRFTEGILNADLVLNLLGSAALNVGEDWFHLVAGMHHGNSQSDDAIILCHQCANHTVHAIGFAPILLTCVTAVALFYTADSRFADSVELAVLAKHHATSAAATRLQANCLFEGCIQELSSWTYDRAATRVADSKPGEVARTLASELSRANESSLRSHGNAARPSAMIAEGGWRYYSRALKPLLVLALPGATHIEIEKVSPVYLRV